MLPNSSFAGGYTTKIDENGKTYVVENSNKFYDSLTCGDLKAIFSLGEISGQQPSIMVVVITATGNESVRPVPKRLIAEFDDFVEDYHTLDDFKTGCLTGDGGIGMIFQSSDPKMEASYIQLDKYGRLFSNFNQTGYTLKNTKP